MYRRSNGRLLNTKIVATLGAPRGKIFNPTDELIEHFRDDDEFWNTFLGWFFVDSMYLIDVIRLNMSYFTPPGRNERRIFQWLRSNKEAARNVAVLADLKGPRVELCDVAPRTELSTEKPLTILFRSRKPEVGPAICVHGRPLGEVDPTVADKLQPSAGRRIPLILGDGEVSLKVEKAVGDALEYVVEKAGPVKEGQRVTLKGVALNLPSFEKEDKQAVDFLIEEGFDWSEEPSVPGSVGSFLAFVGVSFVKNETDVIAVKRYIEDRVFERLKARRPHQGEDELRRQAALVSPDIIAKIETQQARENIEKILDVADGAMVARGDLALQIGPSEVPTFQKHLIRLCNFRGKPVITATEMLASMEDKPEPTRAEANDVFNAILDGSDAVMLSGETSKGRYPFQAVKMMVDIAEAAEKHFENFGRQTKMVAAEKARLNEQRFQEMLAGADAMVGENTKRLQNAFLEAARRQDHWLERLYWEKMKSLKQGITDRISLAACLLANSSEEYNAIVCTTTSGRTVRMISRFKPGVRNIGAAHDGMNRRKLLLCRGVYPVNIGTVCEATGELFRDHEEMFAEACRRGRDEGYLRRGDVVVFTAGTPLFVPGTTNLIQIKGVE